MFILVLTNEMWFHVSYPAIKILLCQAFGINFVEISWKYRRNIVESRAPVKVVFGDAMQEEYGSY